MTIAAAHQGLTLSVGARTLHVPGFACAAGDRLLLVPEAREETADVAASLGRTLTGLQPPQQGQLALFGQAVSGMAYLDTLKMRARIGLVQGRGGLLANRSVRDNIALPLSVHGGLSHDDEAARIASLVADLDLTAVQHLRPHVLDDDARFRACAARAGVGTAMAGRRGYRRL